MAFEVFDNVAFYWFLQVVLGLFLIPQTISFMFKKISDMRRRVTPAHMKIKRLPEYLPVKKLKEDIRPMWSLRFIFLSILWVIFIMLLIQLPNFYREDMADFEPYTILGVEKGAELQAIKRAYRKASLKWHPDKHQHKPSEEKRNAELQFVMVTKAYQALTDEAVMENVRKYGNVDGYQGTSVTIGLPSFLTAKENEAFILIGYLATLVGLCVLAVVWWNHSSKYHKSGIFQESVMLYFRCIKQKDSGRHLINVLAASSEFQEIEIMILQDPRKQQVVEKCFKEVFSNPKITKLPKEWEDCNYVKWTSALLHAFLNGTSPKYLQEETEYVLQETPRLMDVMIDLICTRSDYMLTGIALLELKQRLVQGLSFGEPNLRQLPIQWTDEIYEKLKEAEKRELLDVIQSKPEDCKKMLKAALPAKDFARCEKSVDTMLKMCPDIDLKVCCRTIDEEKIYEEDMITITVKLTRLDKPWEHPEPRSAKMTPPEIEKARKGLTRDYEMEKLEFEKESRFKMSNFDSAIVHSYKYPFQIREKWMVMLYEKLPNGGPLQFFLMQAKGLPSLNQEETMDFRFQAGKAATKNLGIRVMCDSYIGLDKRLDFNLTIETRPQDVIDELEAEAERWQDTEIPPNPYQEGQAKWYYLYCESFLEMVATMILLFLMWISLLQSKWGKKNIQPWVNWAYGIVGQNEIIREHVVPRMERFGSLLEDSGMDFSWMYDEELARQQREMEEKEEARKREAEELQEQLRQQHERERRAKEKAEL